MFGRILGLLHRAVDIDQLNSTQTLAGKCVQITQLTDSPDRRTDSDPTANRALVNLRAMILPLNKIARQILGISALVFPAVGERLKKYSCRAGNDVRLYPASRIHNIQGARDAISIGSHCRITGQLVVQGHGGQIRIGESCFVGEHSRIWSEVSITIGSRVLISHGVNIHDGNSHSLSAACRHRQFRQIFGGGGHPRVLDDAPGAGPIVIEDDAWLGFNSTVLKGVTIGRGAIIGACTLVTRDVQPYTIVAGNPARVVGKSTP